MVVSESSKTGAISQLLLHEEALTWRCLPNTVLQQLHTSTSVHAVVQNIYG